MPALASCRISTKSMPTFRNSSIKTSTSPPGKPNTRSIPASARTCATAVAVVLIGEQYKVAARRRSLLLALRADLLDRLDVVARFAERRHTAVMVDVAGTCVVAGQRKIQIALVVVQQALQITHAAHDVFARIKCVRDTDFVRQFRHQLHQALGAGPRDRIRLERGLRLHDREYQV